MQAEVPYVNVLTLHCLLAQDTVHCGYVWWVLWILWVWWIGMVGALDVVDFVGFMVLAGVVGTNTPSGPPNTPVKQCQACLFWHHCHHHHHQGFWRLTEPTWTMWEVFRTPRLFLTRQCIAISSPSSWLSLSTALLKQAHDVLSITLQKNTTSYGPLSSSSRLVTYLLKMDAIDIQYSFIMLSQQTDVVNFVLVTRENVEKEEKFVWPRGQNLFCPFDQLPLASSKLQRLFLHNPFS